MTVWCSSEVWGAGRGGDTFFEDKILCLAKKKKAEILQLVFFNSITNIVSESHRIPQNFQTQWKSQECRVWVLGPGVGVDWHGEGRPQPEPFCPSSATNFTRPRCPRSCLWDAEV